MTQRYRERSMSKLPLLFAITLFVCPMTNSLWAQERAAPSDPYSQLRPYPDEAQVTYQWAYSCPNHGGCTFLCPGAGASRVIKLDIYLGKIPSEADSHALYYGFATEYSPTAYGFAFSGIPSFFEVPRNKRIKMGGKTFRKESKGGHNTGMSA